MSSSPNGLSETALSPRSSSPLVDDTEATLVLRGDGLIDHASAGARRLLDAGARPLVGDNFFHHLPPSDVVRVAQTLLDVGAHPDGHATGLLQLKTSLGPWQWFKVDIRPRGQGEGAGGVVLCLHERGWHRNAG